MCLLHYTLLISELSSYYFCYKGFVQQPSLHPHVRVLRSKYNVQWFNIRVVDFVNYDSVLIAAFGLLYEVVCKYK